jgi:hypothetical protein
MSPRPRSMIRRGSHSGQLCRRPIFFVLPRITILSASLGRGRWSAFASSQGARIQTSRSSSVVRITGIARGR